MEKRSSYTINTLLEELKKTTPKFKIGQIFETLKSIYPNTKTLSRDKIDIKLTKISFTKPLASSRKDKVKYIKEDSPLKDFFKNVTKGDFLQVVKIEKDYAKCINLSLKEDIVKKYYKEDEITISFDMIADGTIKQFKRKVVKYLTTDVNYGGRK